MSHLEEHLTPPDGDWWCDFCHDKNRPIMWFYPHAEFKVQPVKGMQTVLVTASSMAACVDCHNLIQQDKYRDLIDRCLRKKLEESDYNPSLSTEILEHLFSGMFNGFRSHRAGDPILRTWPSKSDPQDWSSGL